ncbi:MAG: peptidoglycan bridge formation glycyltransferase FemA/FemB family protein [Bacteroidetes bacterium]|nr:peptidoglycan bridge formation glycyltransferase FemA/FemB family protein [Bacteroidota bacterium]
MHTRKKYVEFVDTKEMIEICKDLPEPLKLKLMISNHESKPVAALGWSTFGTTGLPLVAGTGDQALQLKASFLLWWKMVEFYKEHGFTCIDLAGINSEKNPGGHFFKTGLAGKTAKEVRYLGQFDVYGNHVSFILFKIGDLVRGNYRKIKEWFNALAHSKMQLKPSPTKRG